MKILMAVDGSPHSLKALESLLARIAWFREAPAVDPIYVHPPVPYGAAAAWVGKDALHRYYEDECNAAIAPALDRLNAAAVTHEAIRKVGDPAAEIVRQAKEGGYDLLAVGTHGHTALANVVMGSVATKVVASSTVPVLLLR
jgi:nucleotide-binding universal stress UspA family protein